VLSMQAPTAQGEAGAPDYDDSEDRQKTLSEFNSRFKTSKKHWSDWRDEAKMLYDLIAGRQWDAEDEAKLKEALRPMVTFNVAGKYMDAVTGLQINNRQDIRYFPRKAGNAAVDEILTGAVAWGRDLCDQADEETDAFYDATLTGLGWMECYLDKDLDPGGVPAGQRVDNMEMYPDPSARKRNLEDARYVIRIRQMDEDEYEELFGEEYGASGSNEEFTSLDDEEEAGLQIIEQPHDYGTGSNSTAAPKKGKCPVADYQFWKKEDRYLLNHPQLGSKELTEDEYQAYQPFFKKAAQNGQRFDTQKIRRKVYYRAFISHGRIASSENGYGLSPYQGGFTYHAITGKRDRNKNTWFGIGRAITDPQKWLNKFFSTILYIIMSNAKGGVMAEENTFKDARKAESEWANPQSITWLKEGALQKGKIEPKPPSPYPQGLDRLMDFTMNAMPQTTGLNAEILGLLDREQSGVVEASRKQSAMAVIAWAFDAMRRYYRSMGRAQADYVKRYVPEGTLVKINGQDQQQFIPLVKSNLPISYEVIVDEAPTSTNMKERVWALLENMIPQLIQAGMTSIPPEVLDYSPLPADLVQKWKQMLRPDPKKQQLMERDANANVAIKEGEAQKNQTQAQLNMAKARETGVPQQPPGIVDQTQAQLNSARADLARMQAAELAASANSPLDSSQANLNNAKADLHNMQAIKTAAEAGAAQAGHSGGSLPT
jgi:hypothetical protein